MMGLCDECGRACFDDDRAAKEALETFGSLCEGPMVVLCSDCYAEAMASLRAQGLVQ